VVDRPDSQIQFGDPERILHLGQLDVRLPELTGVLLFPVGPQKVAAGCMTGPIVPFVLPEGDGPASKVTQTAALYSNLEPGSRRGVALQEAIEVTRDYLGLFV